METMRAFGPALIGKPLLRRRIVGKQRGQFKDGDAPNFRQKMKGRP